MYMNCRRKNLARLITRCSTINMRERARKTPEKPNDSEKMNEKFGRNKQQ